MRQLTSLDMVSALEPSEQVLAFMQLAKRATKLSSQLWCPGSDDWAVQSRSPWQDFTCSAAATSSPGPPRIRTELYTAAYRTDEHRTSCLALLELRIGCCPLQMRQPSRLRRGYFSWSPACSG
jgi:hypothetical protein